MKAKYEPVAQFKNCKKQLLIELLKIVLICGFLILIFGCTVTKTVPVKLEKPINNCRQTAVYVRDVFNCSILLDEAQHGGNL